MDMTRIYNTVDGGTLMKNIIAYSAEKLYRDFEKADEFFLLSGMKDMELYEKQLAEAARKATAEHMAALYSDMDRMLCEDISRAEKYTIRGMMNASC